MRFAGNGRARMQTVPKVHAACAACQSEIDITIGLSRREATQAVVRIWLIARRRVQIDLVGIRHRVKQVRLCRLPELVLGAQRGPRPRQLLVTPMRDGGACKGWGPITVTS